MEKNYLEKITDDICKKINESVDEAFLKAIRHHGLIEIYEGEQSLRKDGCVVRFSKFHIEQNPDRFILYANFRDYQDCSGRKICTVYKPLQDFNWEQTQIDFKVKFEIH